ncbi:MAG TPA: hypothetical protein VMR62_34050 [Bryobacteraceae bacterium]|jgi:hypothetical protein|nr:hypothetical protein [Bryobacteraceae bacterium]
MLRRPGQVLARLQQRLARGQKGLAGRRAQMVGLQQALAQRDVERDRVLGLYRKGRIGAEAMERQMQETAQEESALRSEMGELFLRLEGAGMAAAQVLPGACWIGEAGPTLTGTAQLGVTPGTNRDTGGASARGYAGAAP